MFFYLSELRETFSALNIFRYITFRSAMAAITSFLICVVIGPYLIEKFKRLRIQERTRRDDCPDLDPYHDHKEGTPTMGGIFIVGSVLLSTLLWADLSNQYIQVTFITCLCLAILGFVDDFIKWAHSQERKAPEQERRQSDRMLQKIQKFGLGYDVLMKKGRRGLSARSKFFWQVVLGVAVGCYIYLHKGVSTQLDVPFFKNLILNLGILYIPFVVLIIVGTSNAVNLTDGLDGLAIGCVLIVSLTLGILSYISGHMKIAEYLFIPYITGSGELTIICTAMMGASLGFLWFNCYPASIFMGDVGSLSLGGTVGIITVFIKKELLLILLGGIFVVEAMSVILQVCSVKFLKRKLFKVSPLHHHLQMSGWSESKIIIRFWIIAIILALLALTTLKVR